ncbi:MAG: type 4a pilus biogenesis protein PilO [Bdellovibrionales bacterium]|nr:type 4a pilus biogenesis protein PilO [Bdellovibrionales bacterium]
MNDFLDAFNEWPIYYKIGAWLGALLFCSYIFWQYFYKSPAEDLQKAEDKVESLQGQIRQQRLLARNLPKIRKEVQELDKKLVAALEELPNKQETSRLLESISDLARDAGLSVDLFRELGTTTKEFYGQKSVSLVVTGTFHQVATFFDEVGNLPRIVNINGVSMKQPKIQEDGILLTTGCTATTFWYLSEEERAAQQQQQKDQAAKRRRR